MRTRPAYPVKLSVSLNEQQSVRFERSSRTPCLILPLRLLPEDVYPISFSRSPHIPDKVPHYGIACRNCRYPHDTLALPLLTLNKAKPGSTVLIEVLSKQPVSTFQHKDTSHVTYGCDSVGYLYSVCGLGSLGPLDKHFFDDCDLIPGGEATCPQCLDRDKFWMPAHIADNYNPKPFDQKLKLKQLQQTKARKKIPTAYDRIMLGWTPFDEAEPEPLPDTEDAPPVVLDLEPDLTEEYFDSREAQRATNIEKSTHRR